jgi:hypothetical protein
VRALVLAVALAGAAGCSVQVAFLTAATTTARDDAAHEPCGRRVGRSCRWQILGAPLGLPQVDEAMDAAMAPAGGRLMRDVVLTSDHSFWVFFGQNCYIVEGEVFR